MGTWGVHSFENDDATEWAAAYRDMGLSVAKSTIDVAMGDLQGGGLPADLAFRAIAACEAVAFALGRGTSAATEAFGRAPVADAAAAEELIEDASALVGAVLETSELKVMWTEAGRFDDWSAVLVDLQARLNGPVANVPEPVVAPVAQAAPTPTADVPGDAGDVHAAIAQLTAEVRALRQETAENILRLAELIEARD